MTRDFDRKEKEREFYIQDHSSALSHKEEIAALKKENAKLKKQLARLKKKIKDDEEAVWVMAQEGFDCGLKM